MITLYDMTLSGNCHKVRLLLSLLALPYQTQPVNLVSGEQWWPDDTYRLAQITAWLSTATNEIANGPALLRVHHKFGRAIDTPKAQQTAEKVLGIIDRHLESRDWLAGDKVSIADIAVYPYLALAPEGDIDIGTYTNIVAWFQRIRTLPGYVPMPGMWQA